jgi:Fe2+ or Zn2+ uptake regulation protein
MQKGKVLQLLQEHQIHPSAQRVAIAAHVLSSTEHPTADAVWRRVKEDFPFVSRATVYNTLNLFVRKGLLRQYTLGEAGAVFDPNRNRHHHFVDEETDEIKDIPWESLRVAGVDSLNDVEVTEYMVLVRGRARKRRGPRGKNRKEEEP